MAKKEGSADQSPPWFPPTALTRQSKVVGPLSYLYQKAAVTVQPVPHIVKLRSSHLPGTYHHHRLHHRHRHHRHHDMTYFLFSLTFWRTALPSEELSAVISGVSDSF